MEQAAAEQQAQQNQEYEEAAQKAMEVIAKLPGPWKAGLVTFVGYTVTALGAYVGGDVVHDATDNSPETIQQIQSDRAKLRVEVAKDKRDDVLAALPAGCGSILTGYVTPGPRSFLSEKLATRYIYTETKDLPENCGTVESAVIQNLHTVREATDDVATKETAYANEKKKADDEELLNKLKDPINELSLGLAALVGALAGAVRGIRTKEDHGKIAEETMMKLKTINPAVPEDEQRVQIRTFMRQDKRLPNPT